MGASPWQTTRRTRARLNAAMPHIVHEVQEVQAQIACLNQWKDSMFPGRSWSPRAILRRIGRR
jgi:hypothetical protein